MEEIPLIRVTMKKKESKNDEAPKGSSSIG
jgi:hypothetical protein